MIQSLTWAVLFAAPIWTPVGPGVWQSEVALARRGPLAAVHAVLVRIDPSQVRFALDTATRDFGLRPAWTIDSLPADAAVGFNTGQFTGGIPWGWLVMEGRQLLEPGAGSLAMSFVVDSGGRAQLLMPSERSSARGVRLAFQSYPALLTGKGELPAELTARGRGVSLTHRDSRLALGIEGDGTILVALTRFTGLGSAGQTLPWGPTVPEMAAFMRSLGCVRAVLLDGGISSQMALRRTDGSLARWGNWRPVPLALIVVPRVMAP